MEKSCKEVSVPATAVDVTPQWISSILGYKINSGTLSITPNAHEGKGYLSNLLRISCEKEGSSEKVNLIVKLIPELEMLRDVVLEQDLDKIEILSYQTILPALVTQVPQLAEYICPFMYGKFEGAEDTYRSVLVLEDLKPFGYYTLDFDEDTATSQLHDGIDFLAKLHFAAALVEDLQGKPLNQVFDFLNRDFDSQVLVFQTWVKNYLPEVLELMQERNCSEDMQKAYAAMTPFTDDIVLDVIGQSIKCPSLIHGDLWPNNILYNTDTSKNTKIIDWQMLCLKDVAVDLAVFIISDLPIHKITNDNVQNLFKKYCHLYQKLCEEKNRPDLQRRDWSEFEIFFNTYGLAFTLIWFVVSTIAVKGKCDERLLQIFEYFYDNGILEFIHNNCMKGSK